MAKRSRNGTAGGRRRRREPVPERVRFDAPPSASAGSELAFPWASDLSIGWGSLPPPPRRNPASPRARKRPAE